MTARHSIPRNSHSVRSCALDWYDGAPGSRDRFEDEIDLEAFASEGRAIARAVKAELPAWSIVYFDEAEAARAQYRGTPADFDIEIP